ncbi:MAG TPA: molybdenum cofactor guanylyltransferase [Atribacterota bacterium]|nr:molybdenum cofactor guanylyltransferase [Atribacterota bacterium]
MFKEKKHTPFSVLVLAGGRSSRMGLNKDKGHMQFKGTSLIEYVLVNILSIEGVDKNNVIIVGPKEKYSRHGFTVVEDLYPQKGPLGGIFSGLQYSNTFYNLVIGYDMPFVESKLVEYMLSNSKGYDMVIPTYGKELYEPLCAIYSKNCLKTMEQNLKNNILAVRGIFPRCKIRWIREEEIRIFDSELHSFFNINFQSDFKKAEILLYQRGKNIGKG